VLFVSGAAAAVTAGGLHAGPHFFILLFPIMIFVLLVFRIGVVFSGNAMRRPFGFVLLAAYGVYLLLGYWGRNIQGS
jgi:Ca2+/Na+ antiporter